MSAGARINPHRQEGRAKLSADQLACWQLVCDWLGGEHHAPDMLQLWGRGIRVVASSARLASWDFNYLSTLVFLAHDRCVRVELVPAGPTRLALVLCKRHSRHGDMYDRHPTLRDAVAAHRHNFLEPVEGDAP